MMEAHEYEIGQNLVLSAFFCVAFGFIAVVANAWYGSVICGLCSAFFLAEFVVTRRSSRSR